MAETNKKFYSPAFIIDPSNKDGEIVQTEWNVGDINLNSKVWLRTSNKNKRFIHFVVEVTRPEKASSEAFSYFLGLEIYEKSQICLVNYNTHILVNTFEYFSGGLPFDHTIPKKYQFYFMIYNAGLPNDIQFMIKAGINPQSNNDCIEKLWQEKLFTDFIFKVKNQEFTAHKSILATQSDVFRAMFTDEHNMQENITNTAEITDISPEAFHQFLEYLYIRKLPKYSDHTLNLYKAAHKYDVKELMNICERIIIENISQENVLEVLELANLFDLDKIRESAFNVIQNEVFPEKQLPSKLRYNVKSLKKMVETKKTYESAILDIVTQASNE